jgi:predicted nucleic acid-binding protein
VAGAVLFDSDVLIDAGRGVAVALDALSDAAKKHTLAVSVITEMELIVGCRNKTELRALDGFLKRFAVLPCREAVSDEGARLLRKYRLSHGLLIPDALVAATALTEELPLVSKNQRDYHFINDLHLLPYPPVFT